MTRDEIKKKGEEKVQAIETLCKQLQVVVTAEQMINQQGFIKTVVYYLDTEEYKLDEEPITPKQDETPTA